MASQRTSTSSGPNPKKGTHDFSKASKKIQKLRVLETPKVRGNVMWTFIKKVEIDVTGLPYAAKLPFQILLAHPNTTLTKNMAMQPSIVFKETIGTSKSPNERTVQPSGYKCTIGTSRSLKMATHDCSKSFKKIKKLQEYVGDLGEKQIRKIRKFQKDQSGLSCDEKMFLSMYPIPMSDPLGLHNLLKKELSWYFHLFNN
ncbi:unnamed protein product [Caenorhabditis nigoni]